MPGILLRLTGVGPPPHPGACGGLPVWVRCRSGGLLGLVGGSTGAPDACPGSQGGVQHHAWCPARVCRGIHHCSPCPARACMGLHWCAWGPMEALRGGSTGAPGGLLWLAWCGLPACPWTRQGLRGGVHWDTWGPTGSLRGGVHQCAQGPVEACGGFRCAWRPAAADRVLLLSHRAC